MPDNDFSAPYGDRPYAAGAALAALKRCIGDGAPSSCACMSVRFS